MRNILDSVVNWTPLLIGVYILVAMLRAHLYYSQFNMPIYFYVERDEIFTIWFFPTVVYAIILCIPFIFGITFVKGKVEDDLNLYYNWLPYLLYLVFFIAILILIFYSNEKHSSSIFNSRLLRYSVIVSGIFLGFFISGVSFLLKHSKKIKQGIITVPNMNRWSMLICLSLNFAIFSTFWQINADIQMTPAPLIYKVNFIDETEMVTDDDLRFIGKTKSNYFFFDKKT